MIRVLVVDDQTLVRQGIQSLLRFAPDIEVVAEAAGGAAALEVLASTPVDVMLLDVLMPGLSGVDVLRTLSARGAVPPTLILTTFDDDETVLQCLRAGARGYLLKDVSLERLVGAIRTVAAGGMMAQPALTEHLREISGRGGEAPPPGSPFALTEREVDVLRLLAGGYSNREIADGLSLSEGTVKNHVSSVLSKLGTRDRTRAVLRALEHGLI
ncbi:response regulator [Deinococcus apachensis]|uniref:response regulator n=1 Tax=Deinococcus apachensis TaxID=309886 RepID=UPI00037988C0|nr:response regulator transcription factor [Deinococcus apachensis]